MLPTDGERFFKSQNPPDFLAGEAYNNKSRDNTLHHLFAPWADERLAPKTKYKPCLRRYSTNYGFVYILDARNPLWLFLGSA